VKPPAYRLRAALEQRAAARKQARLDLAASLRAAEQAKLALDEKERERDSLVADGEERRGGLYEPDAGGLLSMPLVTRRTEALHYVERRIEEATHAAEERRQALARAEGAVEASRQRLVEADRQLKAVEKHREGWLAEWRRATARKEQRQAEEVVTARYAAERAAGEGGEEP
jgi:flagellar biosynthesis chaperone FliJ